MDDHQNNSAENTQATFNIQRVYLKDASLEIPEAPSIFLEMEHPQVEIQLNVSEEELSGDLYEVVLTVTLTTRVKDKVAFLVEAKQAGIFNIQGVSSDQLPQILGIVCPGIIYPYLRANVADLVTRSSFAPIHLAEINFEAFYRQRLASQQAKQNGAAESTNGLLQ